MAPLLDKCAYLALRGGFPAEIVDMIGELQKVDDCRLPDSIVRSEMRDQYGRPAFKKIRRTPPFTSVWGIEAFAPRDN